MWRTLIDVLRERWRSYRHRFVPWIALNLRRNERTLRQVRCPSEDKRLSDDQAVATLGQLFTALLKNNADDQSEVLRLLASSPRHANYLNHDGVPKESPKDTMLRTLGFSVGKMPSSLASAGTGVFVTQGKVPKGTPVAMYPGTVYQADEPVLLQSIRNPFVFRCIDGVLVDGNDRGLSKTVFRSCSGRDRVGPFRLSDVSWLTPRPGNPLAMGQYVNNCSNEKAANVCYQELDVPEDFPLELRQYLPNVQYRADQRRKLRCVLLVSLRAIDQGEELFSNYYTVVHDAYGKRAQR